VSQIHHIHASDLGTVFILRVIDTLSKVPVDLTGYDTLQINFKLPDGSTSGKTATAITPLTQGKIQYVTEASFLTAGMWKVQAQIEHSVNATKHKSEIVEFKVHDNVL